MTFKVAALLTPDMIDFTKKMGNQLNEIEIVTDVYENPNEAINLFHRYIDENDILLFGGPIPYLIVHDYLKKNEINIKKPILYVPYNEISIYRGLFKMLNDFKATSANQLTFSIDYPAESEIRECLEELELNTTQTFAKECGVNEDLDTLVSFHYNLWKQKKVQAVITSVYGAYEQLKSLGLPTYRISPAKSSIRSALQRVILEGKNLQQTESQIAIGIIGLKDETDQNNIVKSNHLHKQKKLMLQEILIHFGDETKALIDWSSKGEIRFITTRGQIIRHTKYFQKIMLMQLIKDKLNLSVYLGIGFGSTAHEAEAKAYEGFCKAKARQKGSCFIVELDGTVHGPIGEESKLKYSIRSNDPELIALAKNVGLSIGTINKLLAFSDYSSTKKFTAQQLATGFGITLRSARRILTKLEMNEAVKIVGEEQPVNRGRPRSIYQINFLSDYI